MTVKSSNKDGLHTDKSPISIASGRSNKANQQVSFNLANSKLEMKSQNKSHQEKGSHKILSDTISRQEKFNQWKQSPCLDDLPTVSKNNRINSIRFKQASDLQIIAALNEETKDYVDNSSRGISDQAIEKAKDPNESADYTEKWQKLQTSTDTLLQHMKLLDSETLNYDIETKYKEELEYLRRERAQRLYKKVKQNKLAWCQLDEPEIHEVLGIERDKRRRMKLIMAKLEARMSKEKSERLCILQ